MTNMINCDHCGHEIDIDQAINSKFQADFDAKNKLLDERERTIKVEAIKANQKQDEIIESRVKEEKALFSKTLTSDYEANFQLEMKEADDVRKELIEQKRINVKLKTNNTTAENDYKLDGDLRVAEATRLERQKAAEREEHKQQEYDVKMKQMQKSIEDAHRQSNQGSMQIQGEAQEQTIDGFLKYNFPLDTIEPIKQGARGGDCLQYVIDNNQNCGVIYYESKNTQNFENSWIEKFKVDMRAKSVDIGVIVTQTMPKDMERAGFVKGIWVCSLDEFKTISYILRKQLIEIHKVRSISKNRKDIASHLYRYLTSSEFKMDMEAIVEGFTDMKSDIDSEKKSFNRMWKKREKQLEKIMLSTVSMYGSLQGISDNSIDTIKGLELPGADCDQIEECEVI